MGKGRAVVYFHGGEWSGCRSPTREELEYSEKTLQQRFPRTVRQLFQQCALGRPAKPLFVSDKYDAEVAVGYVLDVGRPSGDVTTVVEAWEHILRNAEHKGDAAEPSLLPFAIDYGHANYFCLDSVGRVVYRVLDEEAGRGRKVVADSIEEFIDGLEELSF